MANPRPFLVRNEAGPVEGAAAGMSAIAYSARGVARGARAITERGAGGYHVEVTDADEAERTVILINTGGLEPLRYCLAVSLADRSNAFWAFHVETEAGALWPGAAPTIAAGSYIDRDLVERTPPELLPVAGAHLWAAIPTPSDLAAGVQIRFDGPAGSSQPYFLGFSETLAVSPASYVPPRTGALVRSTDGAAVLR